MTLQEWIWELPGVDFVTLFEVFDRADTYSESQNTWFAALQHFYKKKRNFRSRTSLWSDSGRKDLPF